MSLTFDDDILLDVLGDALAPERVEPGFHELSALHRALETWPADSDGQDDVALAPVIPMFTPNARSLTWSRIHRLRHPVAAALAVGILATSGVAAAGVATDRLPGPTRNVAYALGLPVTSPALESARGTMAQVVAALAAHDGVQVRASGLFLRSQMAGLSTTDLAQIQTPATDLVIEAYAFLVAEARSQAAAVVAAGTSVGSGGSPSTGSVSSAGPGSSTSPIPGAATPPPVPAGPGSAQLSGGPPIATTPVTSPPTGGGSGGTSSGTGSPGTTLAPPSTTPATDPTTTTTTRPDGDGSGDPGSGDRGSHDHTSDDHAPSGGSSSDSSDDTARKWHSRHPWRD